MTYVCRCLILGLSFLSIACTKATPNFDLLDEGAIPQPKFSGSTIKSITTASTSQTFNISGECDPKVRDITAAASGVMGSFTGLDSLSVGVPTIQCSSAGTFSFQLKSLADLGFAPLTMGNTYEIRLRSMTSAGPSKPSFIRILYSDGLGNRNIRVTFGGISGGGDMASMASNATHRAEVHVNYFSKPNSSATALPTGAGFVFRPGASGN